MFRKFGALLAAGLLLLQPFTELQARNARGIPGIVQSQAQYKFNPGDYIVAQQIYDTTVANAVNDINLAVSTGTSGFLGYMFGQHWRQLENTTGTGSGASTNPTYTFSNIWQIFNYLQAKWPGAYFGLYVTGNTYTGNLTQANLTASHLGNPLGFFIPDYILDGGGTIVIPNCHGCVSNTSYSVAPNYPLGSTYGVNLGTFNGSTEFIEVDPAWQNPGIVQAWTNMLQALSVSTDPAPTAYNGATTYSPGIQVTSAGVTYTFINATASSGHAPPNTTFWAVTNQTYVGMTLDQNPLFSYIATNDETSQNWCSGSACNFASGTGSNANPPGTVGGTIPISNTQFWLLHQQWLQQGVKFFPTTPFGICDTYGWDASGASSDTVGSVAANINQNIAAGNRSAPLAMSSIQGIVESGADSYGFDYSATQNTANYGKQGYFGIVIPGGATLPTPTVANLIGYMPYAAEVQAIDYFSNVSGAGNNASAVQQIMSAANHVKPHYRIWIETDKTFTNTPWPGYIKNAVVANQAAFPINSLRPIKLMTPVTIGSVTVNSPTSLTITWTPPAMGANENGLTETLLRNGVVCPSCTGLTSGFFTDTGLTTGTLYVYTMAMANTNGTGPAGAGVAGIP